MLASGRKFVICFRINAGSDGGNADLTTWPSQNRGRQTRHGRTPTPGFRSSQHALLDLERFLLLGELLPLDPVSDEGGDGLA